MTDDLEVIALETDKLVLNEYVKTIEGIYDSYGRLLNLARIYSGTNKCMMMMNIASLFYSVVFPEQHYSLLLSLVSFSLSSIFDVGSRYKTLDQLVRLYGDRIIPQVERHIYKHVGKNIKNIKEYTTDVPNSIDYLQEKEEVDNLVTEAYGRYMGESFTPPMGLKYTDYSSILFCIGLYISAFVLVPTLHWAWT